MISYLSFLNGLLSRILLFIVLASATTAVFSQPSNMDPPLMVYSERPLRVDDLKRRYGEKVVYQVAPRNWAVQKPLQLGTVFDFFAYQENEQGDLVEMTGFVMGPCDKVLRSYFQTLFPIQVAERGKVLPARVSSSGVKIELATGSDSPMPYFGGQSIGLDYDKDRPSQSCTLTHTFRRKNS